MSRDYHGEMSQIIEKATTDGDYSPPVLAEEIVAELREKDPGLLSGWLDDMATQILRHQINLLDHSRRGRAIATQGRARFREASEAARRSGSTESLTPFLDARFTVGDGTRRMLRDMSRENCGEVATTYEVRAAQNRMWGVFFRALEKKLGSRTVGDVYTEPQVAAMFEGFNRAA